MAESTLPPWDVNGYFDPITEKTFSLTGQYQKVVTGSPQTVALIFASVISQTNSIVLSISKQAATNQGIVITQTMGTLILTHKDFGPLVAQDWYAAGTAIATLTVYQITLARWPDKNMLRGKNGRANRFG